MSSKRNVTFAVLGVLMLAATIQITAQDEQPEPMGFFITSVGPGNGADLGGLEGADAHCQSLAAAAGVGDRTWRAYLSAQATGNRAAVNARDRIGDGPWANAEGLGIATDVDELHYNNANIRYEYALNERGERVNSGASGDSRFTTPGSPWNMAHPSRGCSQEDLVGTGGNGLFYCFAAE